MQKRMQATRKNKLRSVAIVACVLLTSCTSTSVTLPDVATVRLGMPQSAIEQSKSLFFKDVHGCFDDKAQYNGLNDSQGIFVVHCRQDKCVGIEVKYPNGQPKETAMRTLLACAGQDSGSVVERDDQDLRDKDSTQFVEYLYLKNHSRGEVWYAPGETTKVAEINVWSDE
jgi:hypothetical protein